ncbi:solute carrier family 2, facilitated glucose transporter member 7-like [Dugong dugon]
MERATPAHAAFGSAFQYGYNVAMVNTPHKVSKSFYNETYFERHGTFMDENVTLLLWSCTVSMFPLGGLLGSLVIGLLVVKCCRKGTFLINNFFTIVPAILMGVSKVAKAFELTIFSRVMLGICAGIAYGALPMCLGELGPKNLRGALGTMNEVFIIIGIILAQIFSLQTILGNPTGWPVLLGIIGILMLLQLLSLPFSPAPPPPPTKLLLHLTEKGDEGTARETRAENGLGCLRTRRSWADVEDEIEEMCLEDQAEKAEGLPSVLNLFTFRSLRWQLITIIVLMAGQQFSGVNTINYYTDMIYVSAGVEAEYSRYITVGASVVNTVMTIISAFTLERLGRWCLLLAGYSICASSCLGLTLALLLQNTVPELSYLSVISVFVFITGHAIGPSPVPSMVRTEIFLQSSGPAAFMVDGAVHWLTNFVIGFVFPSIQEAIGAHSFIIFAGTCLLTAVYIHVVIPETKGITFVEINQIFAKRNGVEIPEKKEEITEVGSHVPSTPAKGTALY